MSEKTSQRTKGRCLPLMVDYPLVVLTNSEYVLAKQM